MKTPESKDFYYSPKMERVLIDIARRNLEPYYHATFKGKTFTEQITHGTPPVSKWDDLVLIGTGTSDDVKMKRIL